MWNVHLIHTCHCSWMTNVICSCHSIKFCISLYSMVNIAKKELGGKSTWMSNLLYYKLIVQRPVTTFTLSVYDNFFFINFAKNYNITKRAETKCQKVTVLIFLIDWNFLPNKMGLIGWFRTPAIHRRSDKTCQNLQNSVVWLRSFLFELKMARFEWLPLFKKMFPLFCRG